MLLTIFSNLYLIICLNSSHKDFSKKLLELTMIDVAVLILMELIGLLLSLNNLQSSIKLYLLHYRIKDTKFLTYLSLVVHLLVQQFQKDLLLHRSKLMQQQQLNSNWCSNSSKQLQDQGESQAEELEELEMVQILVNFLLDILLKSYAM